eukprot:scaffold279738_cov31-Tisochrysis_lutea.AAC.5
MGRSIVHGVRSIGGAALCRRMALPTIAPKVKREGPRGPEKTEHRTRHAPWAVLVVQEKRRLDVRSALIRHVLGDLMTKRIRLRG